MSDKYVEIKDTGFTNQYVNKNETTGFVSDKQSAATSYNTGVTLDCYDTLFANYDIFDSGKTLPDDVKYAYKDIGGIKGNYPTKEYPNIYTSNFSKVIDSMSEGVIKNLYSRENIFAELFVPYYDIIKTIDCNNNNITYSYEYVGNLKQLMETTSGNTTEYSGVTSNNYHKKNVVLLKENTEEKIYEFSYYCNNINNENQLSEKNKFNEYGNYLIVNSQKIDITDFFIDVHKDHFMFMERDNRYDIGNDYYAWTYDNKEENMEKYKLCTETIDETGEIVFECNTSCVDESYYKKYTDEEYLYGTKIKDKELIFYTDNEIITNTTNILLIACFKSGNTYYDLYSSQFNNNINLHNFFLKTSNVQNKDMININGSSFKYDEKTNQLKHSFNDISFTMFQNINKSFKDPGQTVTLEQNIFGYMIDYVYKQKPYTLYLNNYEIERFLLSNASIRIVGNSIYINNVIGRDKKSTYQIRFDNISSVKFKTIVRRNEACKYYILKNDENKLDYYCLLKNNIQVIK